MTHGFRAFLIFIISVLPLIAAGPDFSAPAPEVTTVGDKPQPQAEDSKELSYHVRRSILPKHKNQFAVIHVFVDPKHFNRHGMNALAAHLRRALPEQPKLRAVLLDDDNVARNILPLGADYQIFEKAVRGVYQIDRTKCKEFIQFSSKKGRPRNEVTMHFKCSRLQQL